MSSLLVSSFNQYNQYLGLILMKLPKKKKKSGTTSNNEANVGNWPNSSIPRQGVGIFFWKSRAPSRNFQTPNKLNMRRRWISILSVVILSITKCDSTEWRKASSLSLCIKTKKSIQRPHRSYHCVLQVSLGHGCQSTVIVELKFATKKAKQQQKFEKRFKRKGHWCGQCCINERFHTLYRKKKIKIGPKAPILIVNFRRRIFFFLYCYVRRCSFYSHVMLETFKQALRVGLQM